MRVVEDFPHQVTHIEHTWIPLPDGSRLAARIWVPADAEQHPVPALVEYIPYRKRDMTRRRDDINHPWLAGQGYACVRIDLRGSGESDGVLRDQYLEQEQQDGVDAIAWIAKQSWCDGRVGMFGISWGGFNALQIAARRPPALRAIVTACSTDDLYRDNMHYMGGCLLSDNLSEATTMLAFNSCPPDPELVGEAWRERWLERLRESGLWLDIWLRHQRRDDFWKPGSVCEDYARIDVPVLVVSGWADGFTNAVFRLLRHLEVPCRGLIGPWSHKYPHLGVPGPAIGFLQELRRWFDRWLRDADSGVEDDPPLRVWMQQSMPPETRYAERPGRWVAEPAWPSPRIREDPWQLATHGMLVPAGDDPGDREESIASPLTVGLFAGKWCSYASTPDLPADQRLEDGGALVFETPELAEDVELLGRPALRLQLASDRPQAMVAARMSDVRPDGKVTRVTYGLLNLTHRDGHAQPRAVEPGRFRDYLLRLNGIAQRFPAGHRIRLSLSSSYWPLAWPSPRPTHLRLRLRDSLLHLPVRPPDPADDLLRPFEEPEGAVPTEEKALQAEEANWLVHYDLASGRATLDVQRHAGAKRIRPIDLVVRRETREWYSSQGDDPTTARGETRTVRAFERGDWRTRIESRTLLTCDDRHFDLHAQVDAWEDERRVFAETWQSEIERDQV